MAHSSITIDGHTYINGPLGEWQQRAPEQLQELITPNTTPRPYLKAVMVALADAALANQPITINVHTHPHGGWTLTVSHI